ncbi:hypothetical protein K466DRAFT_586020, partial [Polyporus arcularius HHB13444]
MSWYQEESLCDVLRILIAMNCTAESSAAEVQHHHQQELASLREQLDRSVQQLETVKHESAKLFQECTAALAEKESTIAAMEEKLRERDMSLDECKREVLRRDGRVQWLEKEVQNMQVELQKLRRNRDRFAQVTQVMQSLNRDESVDPTEFMAAALDEDSGPSRKRARV